MRFSPQAAASAAGAGYNRLRMRYDEAIETFDDWFNARFYELCDHLEERRKQALNGELWQRMQEKMREKTGSSSSSSPPKPGPPFDFSAMALIGAGAGAALQGHPGFVLLSVIGTTRGLRRFVVQRVDANDMQGLFAWSPRKVDLGRQVQVFGQLKQEIETFRAIRRGDVRLLEAAFAERRGRGGQQAMDPSWDYTPESLFDDVMDSIASHERVKGVLGPDVRPEAMPEKVVFRIVEGISEVFLSWPVVGRHGSAEIQVKATACIVDFIYVFPNSADRYGFVPPGFVIRPSGNWHMDVSEMPKNQKQPFGGGKSGRILHNREGVFEWDWDVRDFRHGFEDHPRRKRWS